MSRFAFMARHPRRTLGVLALLLAATAVTIGSGANFTATSANPTNVFSAGTLTMGNSSSGTAIFTSANTPIMKPGDTRSGTVDIQNTGNITGDFVLGTSNIVNTPASPGLTSVLKIQVEDCGLFTNNDTQAPLCTGSTIKYPAGTIAGLSGIDMGNYAGGTATTSDKHRYKITVSWPDGTPAVDNPLQGAGVSFNLNWSAS
jgi:spore coat-associated protein N